MDPVHLLILVGAGLAAGFVAGLIGVGGGIIFAPVLFFYYDALGVATDVIAPLTIGTSLLCTLVAAFVSAWTQMGRQAVVPRVAVSAGVFSAAAVYLMTRFVTTQPWYDGTVFQIVFSVILLVVVSRMVVQPSERPPRAAEKPSYGWPVLASAGTAAGAVASAAGVGGGIVLVPAYSHFLRLPIHVAVGTSSATIVLISFVAVVQYVWQGWGTAILPTAVGFVDAPRALFLAVPAMLTANAGVRVAHRINRRALRLSFALIAAFVAVRLLVRALV